MSGPRIIVAPGPIRKLGRYDFLINLKIGVVVLGSNGAVCTVENFDITKAYKEMPVMLKILATGKQFECLASEIQAIMVPVDGLLISAIGARGEKHGEARRRQREHTIGRSQGSARKGSSSQVNRQVG